MKKVLPSYCGDGQRISGSPPVDDVDEELSYTEKIDSCFVPNGAIEFTLLGLTIIYYIPAIILYIKNRHHLLIKNRQPCVVIITSILGAIMSILIPVSYK